MIETLIRGFNARAEQKRFKRSLLASEVGDRLTHRRTIIRRVLAKTAIDTAADVLPVFCLRELYDGVDAEYLARFVMSETRTVGYDRVDVQTTLGKRVVALAGPKGYQVVYSATTDTNGGTVVALDRFEDFGLSLEG